MTVGQVILQIYSFTQNTCSLSTCLAKVMNMNVVLGMNIFLKYLNLFPPRRVLVMNEHFIGNDIEVYVQVRCTFVVVYILAEKVGI